MLKRILAWVILIGFVLLLLNIAIFHFYWQVSLAVYVVVIIFFVLSNGRIIPSQEPVTNVRKERDASDDTTGSNSAADDEAEGSMDGRTGESGREGNTGEGGNAGSGGGSNGAEGRQGKNGK